MRNYILLICLFSSVISLGQYNINLSKPLTLVAKQNVGLTIKKGDSLLLTDVNSTINSGYAGQNSLVLFSDKKSQISKVETTEVDKFDIIVDKSLESIWEKALLLSGTYENLVKKGYQYDLRDNLNEDNIRFVSQIENEGRIYNDNYLEDYLYTIVSKIHNGVLKDNRPGNIVIKVVKDTEPRAFVLSNGSVFISTGMMSMIKSEQELTGILAHEIAHFVLDHHILNINKAVERKKRAEFWAGLSTVLAAGADIFLSTKYENHVPGLLTVSTAAISSIISAEIQERLGLKYSREQETEADLVASEILDGLNGNKNALSAVFQRLKNHSIITGNHLALTGEGGHPSLDSRIAKIGKVKDLNVYTDPEYLKKVSTVTSYNAWNELWYFARHLHAIDLVDRNITNGVAVESDYIVKAVAMRRLYNDKKSNEDVLTLIQKAKSLSVLPIIIIAREEALTQLRLGNKVEAKIAFEKYMSDLVALQNSPNKETNSSNIEDEMRWTKTMIFKIDKI